MTEHPVQCYNNNGEPYGRYSEEWRTIKEAPNYMVSNLGNVKSIERVDAKGRPKKSVVLSKLNVSKGYLAVNLHFQGNRKTKTIHRLVAEAFIPNMEGKNEVNHIDGVKTNNNVLNLEWCTRAENAKHAGENYLVSGKLPREITEKIIHMHFNEGKTYQQIHMDLALNKDTVRKLVQRESRVRSGLSPYKDYPKKKRITWKKQPLNP